MGAVTIVILVGMVLARVAMLRQRGVVAAKFGATDKSDFAIPPFALFYFYLVFAGALDWPTPGGVFFDSAIVRWAGVVLCVCALVLMFMTLVAFGTSFRIGIDTENPDKLVTSGVFARTRNPIYVAFGITLIGEFLIFPHWLLLLYILAGFALFHRQVLREEAFMRSHYGQEYRVYCERVPRYIA